MLTHRWVVDEGWNEMGPTGGRNAMVSEHLKLGKIEAGGRGCKKARTPATVRRAHALGGYSPTTAKVVQLLFRPWLFSSPTNLLQPPIDERMG